MQKLAILKKVSIMSESSLDEQTNQLNFREHGMCSRVE